jgi:hypothetical protein
MQLSNGTAVVYAIHGKIAAGMGNLCMPFEMHKERKWCA